MGVSEPWWLRGKQKSSSSCLCNKTQRRDSKQPHAGVKAPFPLWGRLDLKQRWELSESFTTALLRAQTAACRWVREESGD